MIQVYIDKSSLKQNDSAIVVSDNLSYISGYKEVQEALKNNSSIEVIIRKNIFKRWFEKFAERYPNDFKFTEVSRRLLLEENWGISIPQYVDDEDIAALGLQEIKEKPSKEIIFEDFLLQIFYCPVLTNKSFNLDILIDLINCFEKDTWIKNNSNKLLSKIYTERLELWEGQANKDSKYLIEKIIADFGLFRKGLIEYHILKNYRSIISKIIPDYSFYDSLKIKTNRINFQKEDIKDIEDQIVYEINSWDVPVDEVTFLSFIDSLSGLLLIEFEKVKNIVYQNPQLLSSETLRAIEIKFQKLGRKIRNDIDELHQRIPPKFPQEPQFSWNVEQMLSWCKKEYFPYYKWSIYNSISDNTIDEFAEIFSEWYYREYENIVSNHTNTLYKFLPNNYEVFNSNENINIVLIVDNLPWFFYDEIQKIFSEKKFSLSSISSYLSLLPTITEVCKKTLLTAQDRYNKIEEKNYKQILEDKGWVPYFEDEKFKYYPTLGSFLSESEFKTGAYFINYLEIDKLFHKTREEIGGSHIKHFISYIQNIIEEFLNKLEKHNLIDKANIHIISDHGCTYLYPELKSKIDSEYFKSNDFLEVSPRYIKVSKDKLNNIPAHVLNECFTIDEIKFGTPTNYIVPRKRGSFIKIKNHFWSHGGLLPEEVVVPHIVFNKVDIEIKKPDITLKNNSFRYALQKIELEVGNPNEYDLDEIFISFLNTNFESDKQTITIPNIKSKNKVARSIEGRFKKSPSLREQENLNIEIRCTIKSIQYNFETECPIILKSMVETKGDDIFDQLDF